jgi:hypothetical protein
MRHLLLFSLYLSHADETQTLSYLSYLPAGGLQAFSNRST